MSALGNTIPDLRSVLTTELRIREGLKKEIFAICSKVEERVQQIAERISERDYNELTSSISELMQYNAFLLGLDTRVRLSDKSDERAILLALDNVLKMIRYTRDDVRTITQLTMNEANNAT